MEIDGLRVRVEEREILRGVNLSVGRGEVHVIIGPNGSGKSTLALTIAGHPAYRPESGRILFDGSDITHRPPDERARMGLFVAMQHPTEIEGVNVAEYLARIIEKRTGEKPLTPLREHVVGFVRERALNYMKALGLGEEFLERELNVGFSGGERKKFEILQMALLDPKLAVLDEPDSGVDVDSLHRMGEFLRSFKRFDRSMLLITHTGGLCEYVEVDRVHVIMDGKIVRSGGRELFEAIRREGFEGVI